MFAPISFLCSELAGNHWSGNNLSREYPTYFSRISKLFLTVDWSRLRNPLEDVPDGLNDLLPLIDVYNRSMEKSLDDESSLWRYIQLTEYQLEEGRETNLSFHVSMNDFLRVKMVQSVENLFRGNSNLFFFQTTTFYRFNQSSDRTSITIFHHQL